MGAFRDKFFGFIYKNLLRKIFFAFDAEAVHDRFLALGGFLGRHIVTKKLTASFFGYHSPKLEQKIFGLNFNNPVGLAAGFDKEAQLVEILPAVGFGFEEAGSITGQFYPGNKKPRLWRLPKSRGLAVYYGLKNNGCEEIASRIKNQKHSIPLGINIAKTNIQATDDIAAGIADYLKAFRAFGGIGDYFTVNISCPNTTGGEPFLQPENLDKLLAALDNEKISQPVFVKLSPDLGQREIDALLEVIGRHKVRGIICGNLTKKRNEKVLDYNVPQLGGLSGKVVEDLANELIRYVYRRTRGRYVLIGCGGIFSAADAYKKIRLGASLVQLITGMVYEGPQLIGQINRGLVKLLERDGLENIAAAVGLDNRF